MSRFWSKAGREHQADAGAIQRIPEGATRRVVACSKA
jgi:hypothetical protein